MDEQFSVQQALAEGVTKGKLRRLDIPFRGARDLSSHELPADRFERSRRQLVIASNAYRPVAPAGFAFSHATACRLYGVPLPTRLSSSSELHVSVPGAHQPPRRVGIIGHRGSAVTRLLDGLPVVPPEVAWVQVATQLTLDELVVAGDHLVRRKRPFSSLAALSAALDSATRMRGVALARTALCDIRAGTDSPPESRIRLVLIRAGLPEPVIGHTVFHQGAFVGTPDLAYVRQRIAVEYEGADHRLNPDIYEADIFRREMFERAGWRVYLATAVRLRHPAAVAAQVGDLLRAS